MNPSLAVWILIALSLVAANLPFIIERPFLVLPWNQGEASSRPVWLQCLASLAFFVALIGLGYAAIVFIGQGFFIAGDLASAAMFVAKLMAVAIAAAALLAVPGWLLRGHSISKPFFVRLLEVLMFYGLIGVLGFAFEANIGNPFAQTWEFYAITLSLFFVLGYPGFVYRYLLRHRKAPKAPKASKAPEASR
ncbi:DUF2818 family protein [Parapusillimonas sp. SGNA-6]|nr:DUF2818 family protein [Parapusillimonas sp. SGNA-6]